MEHKVTVSIAGVRFTLKGIIADPPDVPSLKDLRIYCLDKHNDIEPFLSENALFMLKMEFCRKIGIEDLQW